VATDVLGYLVQVVSGQPFEAFLQQRILDPLGMVDTSFCVPQVKVERFAANYVPAEEGGLELFDAPQTSRYTRPTRFPSGGGGLLSTAADYARFAQMLLDQGELDGVRLLGRKTVELMAMNHLPQGMHPDGNRAVGFGLGFSVMQDVAQSQILGSVGTFRWGGAASTAFWIDPQEELIAVLMTQLMRNDRYPVARDFQVLVYQALVD
jgi:CubicO group peptidase (beta-lactamase class C family)